LFALLAVEVEELTLLDLYRMQKQRVLLVLLENEMACMIHVAIGI
jgi:hypothetical protein